MKRFLLATLVLVAMAAPAVAADLPARTYKAPPPVIMPVYDWSGFYIGGNGGWEPPQLLGYRSVSRRGHSDGWSRSGGLSVARWATAGRPVRLFSVWKRRATGRTEQLARQHFQPTFTTGTKVNGLGLFTGQIGYAWNATLLYLKGGAAVTSNSSS